MAQEVCAGISQYVGRDSAILMNPTTWVASGHVGGFSDPLMDCKDCKTRHRADQLIEDTTGENPAGWSNQQMMEYITDTRLPARTAAVITLRISVNST